MWAEIQIIEERLSTGEVNRFFTDGEQHSGVTHYLTRDHLRSIREVTGSSGNITVRNDYDPYGRLTRVSGSQDSRFGFTGHMTHSQSGLVLALRRAYDPALGRWLSEDAAGYGDGPTLYLYVVNSPINAWDPYGLQSWPTNYPGVVTGPFGEARGNGTHTGADLRAREGDPVHSTDNGIVKSVTPSKKGGNQIIVENEDGSVSGYAHTKPEVKAGQKVEEGQRIGRSDGSGTGAPHLHLTWRKRPGAPKSDPVPRLKKPGKRSGGPNCP